MGEETLKFEKDGNKSTYIIQMKKWRNIYN